MESERLENLTDTQLLHAYKQVREWVEMLAKMEGRMNVHKQRSGDAGASQRKKRSLTPEVQVETPYP